MTAARYPATTDPHDLTLIMERDHQDLLPEQSKREPFINSVEHGATVFCADIEKVAAKTLVDADGNPVMRRIYVDDAEGMPALHMPTLLRNYGKSSKPSSVFSGNHGQGVILCNGMANPAGLVFISKTVEYLSPYLCYWEVQNDEEGRPVGQLRAFWTADYDEDGNEIEDQGEWSPIIEVGPGEVFDGIDWHDVWMSAYDNPRFNGVPESGTVVVEVGESLTDSTYNKSQRNFDSNVQDWVYSRWATGQYYNSRFWDLTDMTVCWGVPKPGFNYDFKAGEMKAGSTVPVFKGMWTYRTATGLREQIHIATPTPASATGDEDEEEPALTATVVEDKGSYPHGTCPYRVEVYIRELPPGVIARKLNFPVRRQGKIFIDYNGEIFDHPNAQGAHAQFGMTDARLRENVWLRIIPLTVGEREAGAVWMPSGRKELMVHTATGGSVPIPWIEMAERFKHAMPPKLVAAIKALDDKDTNIDDLNSAKFRKWWQTIFSGFQVRKVKEPVEITQVTRERDASSTERGDASGRRGPVVNPGVRHTATGTGPTRRPPRKKPRVSTETILSEREVDKPVKDRNPEPPIVRWVMDIDAWGIDDARYAVRWEDPSTTNQGRGKVYLNWNHWYIQQKYEELTGPAGVFNHAPAKAMKRMKEVFGKSVVTKIGHRRNETRSQGLHFTPDDLLYIFSPAALTGFVLGIWDHEEHLQRALGRAAGRITSAGDLVDEDEDEADEVEEESEVNPPRPAPDR